MIDEVSEQIIDLIGCKKKISFSQVENGNWCTRLDGSYCQ